MIEKKVLAQMKKLFIGVLMYSFVFVSIMLGVASFSKIIEKTIFGKFNNIPIFQMLPIKWEFW